MSFTVTGLAELGAQAERNTDEEAAGELILRLKKPMEEATSSTARPGSPPHVTWAADVIDNEHLGRLKSNCCCIYTKPRKWDEPETWEQICDI